MTGFTKLRLVVALTIATAFLVGFPAAFAGQSGSGKGGGGQNNSGGGNSGGNGPGGGNGSGQNNGGGGGGNSGGGGGGFSIEAEILAYKALQSDSEAIACDIVGFLAQPNGTVVDLPQPRNPHGHDSNAITNPRRIGKKYWGDRPDGKVCQITVRLTTPTPTTPGVVMISPTGATLTNFQLWRLNMAIMKQFRLRAVAYSCPPPRPQGEAAFTDAVAAADQVVTLVKDVVGLFATTESVSGVTGTIQDQALIDAVGRQLRAINVPVLMPDTYSPFTLGGIDYENSPFLASLTDVLTIRACLQAQQTTAATALSALQTIESDQQQIKTDQQQIESDQQQIKSGKLSAQDLAAKQQDLAVKQMDLTAKQSEINDLTKTLPSGVKPGDKTVLSKLQKDVPERGSLISGIDTFLANLNGTPSQTSNPSGQNSPNNSANSPNQSTTPQKDNGAGPSNSATPAGSTPPIASALAADGLARAIGVNTNGDLSIPGWHLLWLKALESGGTMLTKSNLLGSKIYFSGGAVSTYALFELNGQLSCSGNLFDYSGNIREKNFQQKFRKPNIDPENQLIFFRGRCSVPEPTPLTALAGSSSANLPSSDALSIDKKSVVFPDRAIGDSSNQTLNLVNNTNRDIPFKPDIDDKDDFEIKTDCGTNAKASQTCVLEITFKPKTEGKKNAILTIQPPGPVISVPLSGNGKAAQ